MSVPGGAAGRREPHTNRFETRGRGHAHNFIEPNSAGKICFGSFAAGMKFGGEYLHSAPILVATNLGCLPRGSTRPQLRSEEIGRVPHVRTSVRGTKTDFFQCFYSMG